MGCGGSKELDRVEAGSRAEGHFIVDWISATGVPRMDSFDSNSDPFLKTWLEDALGLMISPQKIQSQSRRSTTAPVWHSIRDYGYLPQPDDVLVAELWDKDSFSADDLIGTVRIPVSKISTEGTALIETFELTSDAKECMVEQDGKLQPCQVMLKRFPAPQRTELTFFVIRHGESKWNEAMAEKAVGAMCDTDHELNIVGINQAIEFNKRWKESQPENFPPPLSDHIQMFREADQAIASPLSRAVQTALITLHGHPALSKGLTLSRLIREQKNTGGFDTVGSAVGSDISKKVEEALAKEFAEKEPSPEEDPEGKDRAASYMVPIDPGDAASDWWTKINDKDSQEQILARLKDWLGSVHLRSHHGTIFVGHSLFFKALMVYFTGQTMKKKDEAFYDKLRSSKLCNAGCAAVTMTFEDPSKPEIIDVQLLFDTELLKH